MKWIWAIVTLLLIGCTSGMKKTDYSGKGKQISVLSDSSIYENILPNGLHIIVKENHHPQNRIYLRLVVNAGSILEDSTQLGLAHFVEHMAFNGTQMFPHNQLIDFLERAGMKFGPDLNAYTGFDETVYMLQIPADSVSLIKTGIKILKEWAFNISFDSIEVEKERGVIHEEWRKGLGVGSRLRDKVFPVLFDSSRYVNRLPIGKMSTIDSFKHRELVRFYKKWYRPDLMAVIAVGDLCADSLTRWISNEFDTRNPNTISEQRPYYMVRQNKNLKFLKVTDPELMASKLSLYFKNPADTINTPQKFRLKLVERMALGLLNQRLLGLSRRAYPPFSSAYVFSGRNLRTSDLAYLTITSSGSKLMEGFQAVLNEVKDINTYGFSPAEFRRRKQQVLKYARKRYLERKNLESSFWISRLQTHFLRKDSIPSPEMEYKLTQRMLKNIQVDELNNYIRNLFDLKRGTIVINGSDKDSTVLPERKDILMAISRMREISKQAIVDEVEIDTLPISALKPGKIIRRDTLPEIEAVKYELQNGVTVYAKHTNFKNDEVVFHGFSAGGNSLLPDSMFMSAVVAASIARQSGLGAYGKLTLSKKLANKIAVVVPYIENLYEGFSGRSSSEHLKTAIKLLYLYVTQPRFEDTALQSYKNRIRVYLENREESPINVFSDTVQYYLSNGHFRTRTWSLERLKEIKLPLIRKAYLDRFSNLDNFTFIIVGNYKKNDFEYLLKKYIGNIPVGKNKENWHDCGIRFPDSGLTKIIYKGKEDKAITQINFTGEFQWELKERMTLGLVTSALSIRLREIIREEKRGSYNISVWDNTSHFPVPDYRIVIQYTSSPDRVDELLKDVIGVIDTLKNKGFSEDLYQRVKETRIKSLEKSLQSNDYWLGTILFKIRNNEPLGDVPELSRVIDGVSIQDMNDILNKYFTENFSTFIMMPQ